MDLDLFHLLPFGWIFLVDGFLLLSLLLESESIKEGLQCLICDLPLEHRGMILLVDRVKFKYDDTHSIPGNLIGLIDVGFIGIHFSEL